MPSLRTVTRLINQLTPENVDQVLDYGLRFGTSMASLKEPTGLLGSMPS